MINGNIKKEVLDRVNESWNSNLDRVKEIRDEVVF
jgi:hypothetical protein